LLLARGRLRRYVARSVAIRLILDLNRASDAVGRSIAKLRQIVGGLKALFLGSCT
jgi:hypothetical protein